MSVQCTLVAMILALVAAGACAIGSRPRIFIGQEDLARLRAMAGDGEQTELGYVPAEGWDAIRQRADEFVDAGPYHYAVDMPGREGGPSERWEYTLSDEPPPRHDEYGHYPPWTAMFQEHSDGITTRLKYLLLAYVVTEDDRYFARAKRIVLHLCAWPQVWTDPSYGAGKACLDTGHAATWVSIFYDWCYDDLTDEERATVRESLVEKALVPIRERIDEISAYHNYNAVIACGLLMGGIALHGEEERAEGWIAHAIERSIMSFDAQGADGGAMEGPMYGTYAANCFADMIWALNTAGIANPLMEHNYIETLPRYCISLLNPNDFEQPCFGDGGTGAGFGRLMLVLALAGDSDAAWYCQKTGQFTVKTVRGYIAMDPERLEPVQPAFNPSDCFVDVGYGILRDGYEAGTAFMAFKCGPPEARIGHNHFDHNSFTINHRGNWVAWDPGYRSYFNPPARKYTVSTFGHNSMVVDLDDEYLKDTGYAIAGHDQVHVNRGRIKEFFTSEDYDYLLGSAGDTYNTEDLRVLERFDRQVVFAKPNVFFIRDRIVAPQEHSYTLLLHMRAGGFEIIDGNAARGNSLQGRLDVHIFCPDGLTLDWGRFPGAERYGPYLAATTGRARETQVMSVVVPRQSAKLIANPGFEDGKTGWQPRNMPGFAENHVIDDEVKHSGDASARIDGGGYYYSSRFSLPAGTKITARWWAKCTAEGGASSIFYYWRDGKAFDRSHGPAADANEWRRYEFTDTVPEGTERICLALQFFGEGKCWYDDVEIEADYELPDTEPAVVAEIGGGADGIVAEVNGITHILVCGESGEERRYRVGEHDIMSDAEMAVVSVRPDGATAFVLEGSSVEIDGDDIQAVEGIWRVHQ